MNGGTETAVSERQIRKLKARARKLYSRYMDSFDQVSCGHKMHQHIRPGAYKAALEFDEVMAELRRLDPACPKSEPLAVLS